VSVLIKIALRNVIKNKRRSLLIGLAIFISCFILLVSNAVGNGTAEAILSEYYYQQAGDVVLLWENAMKIENDSPSRIYISAFDADKEKQNKVALARLHEFLSQHNSEIKDMYRVVRRPVVIELPRDMINANVYGMEDREWAFLRQKRLVNLEQGGFDPQARYTVIISQLVASSNGLKVGDWITLDATSAYGAQNSLDFKVTGIYKNGVPWNNDYIYMWDRDARVLYDFDPEDFDSMRIYLKDPSRSTEFAEQLDSYLTSGSNVLRALPGKTATVFFSQQADFFKSLYTFFVIFLLVIIAFGIRATVRLNLFERMREFGTLRAIGYNRTQNFFIIFCEIFLLAFFSLFSALICTVLLIFIVGQSGIYIGSGAISYLFGGDYLYPVLYTQDLLLALVVILALSLLAPLKPGLKLCFQKITDTLRKYQQRSPLTIIILKSVFRRGRGLRALWAGGTGSGGQVSGRTKR
jgi:putative ABC transport system permease protein